MAILGTLAELMEYFKGWHKKYYNELHDNLDEATSTLETKIKNWVNNQLNNYYTKTESDREYRIKEGSTNKNYSNQYLLIDPNKNNPVTNEKYIQDNLGKYKDMLESMYNPQFGLIGKSDSGLYKNWGYFTNLSRFGALRILDMGFDGALAVPKECWDDKTQCNAAINAAKNNSTGYAFKLPLGSNGSDALFFDSENRNYFIDKNGTVYWLLTKLEEIDAPLNELNGGSFELPTGHIVSIVTYNNDHPSVTKVKGSDETVQGYLPQGKGSYIRIQSADSGYTKISENINLDDPIQLLGTIIWVAKNKE